jgi:hypothetical protein
VYVTDGAHVLNKNLRSVENLVRQQNKWVTSTGKHFVSIAVVVGPDSRHAVEGAYLAQYEINHPTGKPATSLVRLLLAEDSAWQQTAAALVAQHVIAVTGLGGADADLAHALAARHIAMVGTGDLTGISGLVRVTPTYPDEVRAAIQFLDGNPDPHNRLPARPRMWLMQDENDADGYAIALGDAYPAALKAADDQVVGPGSEYDSSVPAAAAMLAASATAGGHGVCLSHVNVVYFAGTAADLPATLAKLAQRSCAKTQPLTVLTGSDAARLTGHADLWPATSANMDVYFTAQASPGLWTRRPALAAPATTAWFGEAPHGFRHAFPAEPADALDDGTVIVSHDAVLAAANRGAVTPVPGASGYLCFDKAGDPVDRAIPIVQLSASGVLTYRGVSGSVTRC